MFICTDLRIIFPILDIVVVLGENIMKRVVEIWVVYQFLEENSSGIQDNFDTEFANIAQRCSIKVVCSLR